MHFKFKKKIKNKIEEVLYEFLPPLKIRIKPAN